MTSLQIIPEKKTEKDDCCSPCSPCCDEKPRFPRACLEGSALDALESETGELNVDDEVILTNVRVRVVSKSHTEWRRDMDIALLEFDGSEQTEGGSEDGGEDGGGTPMERAVRKVEKSTRKGGDSPA